MNNNSNKVFNIGDSVWLATCGQVQKTIPCEVCYGKKQVKLILGNDEECILDCDYCGKGYNFPSGYTTVYEYAVEPKQAKIVGINLDSSGEYQYTCSNYYGEVFLTKEECLVRCTELVKEHEETQQKQMECCKFSNKKSYSWNAGYHRTEAKRAKQQLEYHTKKAVFMAAKSKTEPSSKQ